MSNSRKAVMKSIVQSIQFVTAIFLRYTEFFSLDRERRLAKKKISTRKLRGDSVILVEAWQSPHNQLGISIFLPLLAKRLDARAVSFYAMQTRTFSRPKEFLRHFFSFSKKSGCLKFHIFSLNSNKHYLRLAKVILGDIVEKVDPLRALENFVYRGVEIGDLIYDQFLRMTGSPTLDIKDQRLVRVVHDYLLYVDQLKNYFKDKNVKAVIVGETTYRLAVPARIAIASGLQAYHVSGSTIFSLNSQTQNAYLEAKYFKNYGEKYLALPDESTLLYGSSFRPSIRTTEISWTSNEREVEIVGPINAREGDTTRILVACHSFLDAPHVYGINLFPDFFSWLDFIGNLSNNAGVQFLLKPHPSERQDSSTIFDTLKNRYPKLVILPRNVTNADIIQMGIDAVLTVYGTVALEYSQYGIPVITASSVGPYSTWEFCYNPSSVREYGDFINQFQDLRSKVVNIADLKLFLYLEKHLLFKSWLFHRDPKVLNTIRSTPKGYTWDIFRLLGHDFNSSLPELLAALEKFLDSKDYFLHKGHYN